MRIQSKSACCLTDKCTSSQSAVGLWRMSGYNCLNFCKTILFISLCRQTDTVLVINVRNQIVSGIGNIKLQEVAAVTPLLG
ncbi:hypothetical protein Trydic_g7670 [Trypoxylus dichotomus]